MTASIVLPQWLVVLLALFAAIAVVDRIFVPSVRWFFRGRINRAIDELNQRLRLRIQPFKLTRRQTLVDQLMYDQKVLEAVESQSRETGVPRSVLIKKAERYAREIVPSFSALAYFGFGTRAARWLSQLFYRVRLGYADEDALRDVDPSSTVVFVMNHRSNMDYVLVTFMASTQASLSYAVGEWARIFLLESLIRSMGAYFIRRNSNDPLYRRVLGRYVAMATRQGVTQAVFPEGGLSRDGRLGQPKLGILSYIVADFDGSADRDIVFIPVGINYDRVLEDRVLTAKSEREISGRDFRPRLSGLIGFLLTMAKLRITGRLYRFGYACVSFGKPVSLREWERQRGSPLRLLAQEERFEAVSRLGADLLSAIGKIIPALPVALASRVFLDIGEAPVSELELKSRVGEAIAKLEARGIHVHVPRSDLDYATGAGLRMLTLRKIVIETGEGLYRANAKELVLLRYYANSIAHLLP
jgi:glycerol-3-phosphate O-acyltransferase